MPANKGVLWQPASVVSPSISEPVSVIAAKDITYVSIANRLQNLSIYVPHTPQTEKLIGTAVDRIPNNNYHSDLPQWQVHIHGGAWRDPNLNSTSIEAAVAHAFSDSSSNATLSAIISINYTLSPFPTHPNSPYDPLKNNHTDPAREAQHPDHISDILHSFELLRSLGLVDGSYILSGHSCGACLAFQAAIQPPQHWGFEHIPSIPRPAALIGLNGLYDLPSLVDGLGDSHAHLESVYADLIGIALGTNRDLWPGASPARVDPSELEGRLRLGNAPRLIVVDQSTQDQLVPMNQMETMRDRLKKVPELRVVQGNRCVGLHAAPWEQGIIICESVKDVLELLAAPE